MEIVALPIDGPFEMRPRKIGDERGYFVETFRLNEFEQRAGRVRFVQDNQSFSSRAGTVRGIHFQIGPAAQGKLVRCLAGKLLDVAVDLRSGSTTFGRSVAVVLSPEDCNSLWVPVGFGHGFCTLEPDTVIGYKVTAYYSPEHDKGVAWDDPELAIDWPAMADPESLSAKDRALPPLRDVADHFRMGA